PSGGQCVGEGAPLLNEHLPDDLYTRWVQFGTFQPLDRLHSNHGDRLPWQYGGSADAAAAGFLRLREALNPYIYTLARRAYDTGAPIDGPLYLQWPASADAYRFGSEFTFGSDMVIAPVTAPGDPAPATVWIPPGAWVDYFTGARYRGPSVQSLSVPLSRIPVLVRAGAVIPTEPAAAFTPAASQRSLILSAFAGGGGHLKLYDDQGAGFGYTRGAFTWTQISHAQRGRRSSLTIDTAEGRFTGAPAARTWEVRFLGVLRPSAVTINRRFTRMWSYDAATHTLTVNTGSRSTRQRLVISTR